MNKHEHHDHSNQHSHAAVSTDTTTAKDPVCGMAVTLDQGKPSREHEGQIYHFCSQKCHDKFAADPEHFLSGEHRRVAMPEGTQYTCPMHPEVVRDAPGDCPICGMALEPMGVPTGEEGPNPELVDFMRRFWVGAVLTVPLLVLTMGPYLGFGVVREFFGERATLWIELVLGTPVILWAGWPFFVRGVKSVINRSLNMFTLIGMGVGAAFLFSVVAVLAPLVIVSAPPVTLPPTPPVSDTAPPSPPVVLLPAPAVIDTAPPATLSAVVAPAVRLSAPPAPTVPAPTLTETAPPVPPAFASPEPMDTEPVVPELDVPELNFSRPEAPVAPAFAERIVRAPLVVSVLAPASISRAPPVTLAPTPDATSSLPPWPPVVLLP